MKRFVMSALIFLMLAVMMVPFRVLADDTSTPSTMTPYDWLNQEEQAYVTALRADILVVQTRVKTAKDDLGSTIFGDLKTWFNTMDAELGAVDKGQA